jgi:hypothetical protein
MVHEIIKVTLATLLVSQKSDRCSIRWLCTDLRLALVLKACFYIICFLRQNSENNFHGFYQNDVRCDCTYSEVATYCRNCNRNIGMCYDGRRLRPSYSSSQLIFPKLSCLQLPTPLAGFNPNEAYHLEGQFYRGESGIRLRLMWPVVNPRASGLILLFKHILYK